MACLVFRVVIFRGMEDTQVDILDSVTFRPSTTLDPHHRDDGNDKRGRLTKFKLFVAVENTATEFNDEYRGKLTGDELQQALSHGV